MRAPRVALVACLLASCYRDADSGLSNHGGGSSSGDELAYLPVDSEMVFGLDVARMRSSPLWARFEPRIAAEAKSDLDMIRTTCGFDPTQTVKHVSLGFSSKDDELAGVVVIRGIVAAHMLDCLASEFGKGGDAITDRGVVIVDPKSHKASAWTIVGNDTVVAQIGPGVNHDSLMAIVASGTPLRSSPIFMSMYEHLEHGASAWGVVNGASHAIDFFEDVRPRTIDGTIVEGDGMRIAVRFKMATPANAQTLSDMVAKDLSSAPFLTRHDASVTGSTLKVDITLTGDQLEVAFKKILG